MPNERKDMAVIRLGLINKQGSRIEPTKTGKGSLAPWSIMGVALATGANSHSDNPQTNTPETNTPPVLSLRPLKWVTISNADIADNETDALKPIRGEFIAIDIDKDILTYSVINRPDNEMDFGKFTLNPNTGEWVFAFNEDVTFDEPVDLMFEIKVEDGKGGEDIEIFTIILGSDDGVLAEPLSDNELNPILADFDEELGGLILPVSDTQPDLFGRPPFINRDDPQDDPRDYFPDDRDDPRDDNRDNTRGNTPDDPPDDMPDDMPDSVNNAPVLTPSSYGRTITDESADDTNVPDPTSGVFMAMDADNDDLIWTVDEPSNVGDFGSFTLSEDTGVWVFMPNAGINSLGAGVREVLEFTITVDDQNGGRDTATVTITLEGVNDAPREVISDGLSVIEGEASDITMARLRFNDADNTKAELIYTITDAPDHGTLLLRGEDLGSRAFTQADIDARDVRYQHGGSENLADSFAYSVSDGANTVTGSFAITVAPISDAPTQGRSGGFSVAEGGESAITTALLEFSDVDNTEAELTYTIDVAPLHGTLQLRDVDLGSGGMFTQAHIDAGDVRYQHDGSENHADSFAYSVSDGENTVTGSFAITILPVNDAPVQVRSGGFSVIEGEVGGITTALLQFTDVDNTQAELIYTIDTAPLHGTLQISEDDGSTWRAIDLDSGETFTQANIDAGDVRYQHGGSENRADIFTYSVNDGTNTGTVTGSFAIAITSVSDAPMQVSSSGLTGVNEGEVGRITTALLEFTDVDNGATELTYTIDTAPDHGRLERLDGGIWQNTNTFTQDDIDGSRVRYQHDGSENHDDSFEYSLRDGTNTVPGRFAITISPVNDAPMQVRSDGLTGVNEGEIGGITTALLQFSDVDNAATDLTYTINTAPLHGRLEILNGSVWQNTNTFTQADIDGSRVRYEHDGSENHADSFAYSVSDGVNSVRGSFDITITPVSDAPTQQRSGGFSVAEGEAAVIMDTLHLQFNDVDNAAAELTYAITDAPEHGRLEILNGSVWENTNTFTQDDIDEGRVRYQHDGSENHADSFTYSVSDSVNSVRGNFAITISPVNDAPVQVRSVGISVAEGEARDITTARLEFSDVDNTEAELTYTITDAPDHGMLLLRGVDLGSGGTFTQDDIDEGRVQYQHDGSENRADSFAYSVSDGVDSVPGSFDITVAPVSDAPTQVRSEGLTGVNEGEVGGITTALLQFTDVDNGAADLTYTIDVAPLYGTLLLRGADLGSRTFTQDDIDEGRVQYQHDGSENHDDSFEYSVRDGTNTVPGSFAITVDPVSDAPTQVRSDGLKNVNEGEVGEITTALLQFTDVDNAAADLTYTIDTAPLHGRLQILNGSVWQNTNTFTQADIDGSRVRYQHGGSENHDDSFTYSVSDGENTVMGSFDIAITPVSDAPVQVSSGGFSVAEGGASAITSALLEFTDEDNTATELTYTITDAPDHGGLEISDDGGSTFTQNDIDGGRVRYQHGGSENHADSFAYSVSDGTNTVQGSFAITVDPVSDAPVQVRSEGFSVAEGEAAVIMDTLHLQFNDVDNTEAELVYTITNAPLHGKLQLRSVGIWNDLDGGTFTQANIDARDVRYQHDGDEDQTDSFEYSVRDGAESNPNTNTVTGSFAITIIPVSDAPTQERSGGFSVAEGEAAVIMDTLHLQFNDVDNTATDLTYTITDAPDHGRLEILNGSVWENTNTFTQDDIDGSRVRYQHDGSENHADSFAYSVSDSVNSVRGNFAITISPVNDAPVQVRSVGLSVAEGAVGDITTARLEFTDVDNTEAELIYTIDTAPLHGTLQISEDDGSTWRALDLDSGETFTQADINRDTGANRVRYEHDGSENRADSFTYSVSDGVDSVPGSFDITVAPVSDSPTQVSSGGFSVAEGGASAITSALLQFNDVDNGVADLTYTIDTAPDHGRLEILNGSVWQNTNTFTQDDIDGSRVRYQHDGSENHADSFAYSVRDGENTVPGSFAITIIPVSDAPMQVRSDGLTGVNEGEIGGITTALLQFTDVDNTAADLTYTIDTAPLHGRLERLNVSVWQNTNTFTQADIDGSRVRYQHGGSENHADSFAYSVSDGVNSVTGNFAITITPVSDAPTQVRSEGFSVAEGGAAVIMDTLHLQFNDVDNAAAELTYTITDAPEHGRLEILNGSVWQNTNTFTQDDIDGSRVRYQHDGSENHDDSFTYSVSDSVNSVTGNFAITISPVNDAPVQVRSVGLSVAEGAVGDITTARLEFSDMDNTEAELIYTITNAPLHGTLQISEDDGSTWRALDLDSGETFTQADINRDTGANRVRYEHDGSENRADSFTYSVSDGVDSVPGSFDITVAPVSDAPTQVRSEGLTGVNEGEVGGITTALLQFTDVDNGAADLTYTIDVAPLYGTLLLRGADLGGGTFTQDDIDEGRVQYQHDGSENHADSFEYSVRDGTNTVTGSFAITVDPVSDAPTQVRSDGLTNVNEGEAGGITTALLQFTDVDNTAADLTYTIDTAPLHGRLERLNVSVWQNTNTFTQADIDGSRVRYQHGGSENHADSFAYSVSDGVNSVTGNFAITITPVSDAPTQVRSEGFSVAEGEAAVIMDTLHLQFNDVDNMAAELTYTITDAPDHGRLERLNGSVWQNTNTFTQDDIDAGDVRYQHDGSENHADSFTYSVSDSVNSVTGNFAITITPVSDAPMQVRSDGLTNVNEGEIGGITTALLQFTDVDNTAVELTYTITDAPDHGRLEILNGSVWQNTNTFTQDDIDEGRVQYQHDGSENHADSFEYSVRDGTNTVTGSFAITILPVSDAPMQESSGGFSVAEGEASAITSALLQFTDVDNGVTDLTYTIGVAPLYGTLLLRGEDLGSGGTFTQDDIDGGRVQYQHDGSENHADSFTYSVNDGENTVMGNFAITITPVSDAPMQVRSDGLTNVNEGEIGGITTALLQFSDVDNAAADLTYTINTAPLHGRLERLNGSVWQNTNTFTQADIDGSRVRYQHDGSENHADSFAYSVSDGVNSVRGNFAITITPVSDAPTQERSGGFSVAEGEAAVIMDTLHLQFNDVDNMAAELTYTITDAPDHGRLERLNGSVWQNTNTFTQDDIDAGDVRYQHDGSENHADSFTYSVSDSVNSVTGNFAITITPVSDAPMQVRSDGLTNVNEGEIGGITTALLQFTDVDNTAVELTYTITDAPDHGRLEILNGSVWQNTNTFTQDDIDGNRVRYQHDGSENHADSFAYSVSDSVNSVTGNFAITISPVNDAPTATETTSPAPDKAVVESGHNDDGSDDAGDNMASGSFTHSDPDMAQSGFVAGTPEAARDGMTNYTSTPVRGMYGTLTLTSGTWSYEIDNSATDMLDENDSVTDSFSIRIRDTAGEVSNAIPIDIMITGTNDRPVITTTGGGQSLTDTSADDHIGSASAPRTITGTAVASDVDADDGDGANGADDFTWSIVDGGTRPLGMLVFNNGGVGGDWTFTADADAFNALAREGRETLTYHVQARDLQGAVSEAMDLTITLEGINDTPELAVNMNMVDNDVTEAGGVNNAAIGDAMADGSLTITDPDIGHNDFAFAGNTLQGRAGTSGIFKNANGVVENGMTSDGQIIGTYGTLTLERDGTWSYALRDDDPDTQSLDGGDTPDMVQDVFQIQLVNVDGTTEISAIVPITIDVTGANDAPTIITQDPNITTSALNPIDGTLDVTDPDADDGDDVNDFTWEGTLQDTALARFVSSFEITPSTSVNAQGDWSFTPDETAFNALNHGQRQQLVYDIRVTDRQGAISEKSTLTITLEGVEDAPTLMVMDTQTPRAKERGGHNNNQRTTSATSGAFAAALTGAVALGAFAYDDADAADTGFGAGGTIQGRHSTDTDADYEDGGTVNGMNIAGTYGTLSLRADGSWEYVLNEANAAVQALNDGEVGVLTETFQFRIQDIVGTTTNNIYSNVITIDIDIEGTNDAPELTVTYDETTEVSRFVQEDTTSDTQSGDLTFADVDQGDTIPGLIVFASTTDGGIGSGTEDTTPPLSTAANVMRVDAGATTTVRDDYGDFELTRDAITGQVAWTYRIDDTRAHELRQWVDGQANSEEIQTLYVRAWDKASGGLASDIHTIQVEVRGTNDAPEIAELGTPDKAITESGHGDAVGTNVFADDDGVTGDVGLSALSVNNPNSDRVANGRFSFTDPDLGQGGFNTDVGGVNTITGGTIQAVHADDATSPTYTDVASTAATVATGQAFDATYGRFFVRIDGTWSYVVDNTRSVTQELDEGDMMQDVFSIRVRDNDHAVAGTPADTVFSEALVIRITITGTNDRPTIDDTNGGRIFRDASDGSAPETLTGTAVASDVDADDGDDVNDFRWIIVSSSTTTYGGLVFDNGGRGGGWTFTTDEDNFNVLPHGVRLTITYSVQVLDPQGAFSEAADLTITLEGVNDTPEIVATLEAQRTITDDDNTSSTNTPAPIDGMFRATDVDSTGIAFRWNVVTRPSGEASYGRLTVNSDGDWKFALNDAGARAINMLGHDDAPMDITYTIEVDDRGTENNTATQQFTIRLMGIDDVSTNLEHVDTGVDLDVQRPGGRSIKGDETASGTLRFMDVDGDTFSDDHIFIQGDIIRPPNEVADFRDGSDIRSAPVIGGIYGDLSLRANGTWVYVFSNDLNNPLIQALGNGDSATDSFSLRIQSRIAGRVDLNSLAFTLDITVRGMEVMALTKSDTLTDIIYDEVASGQILAMVGDSAPRGDTTFTVALNQDDDGAASLDNDIGRFEIGDDGSWTYTITSIPALDAAADADGSGPTLDPGEALPLRFFITAHNDTIQRENREETISVDVMINGMDIITPDSSSVLEPSAGRNTAYIGDDNDNTAVIVNGRHIVFGGRGDDTINYNANHQGDISFYHRFESLSSGWENTDGEDIIRGFTRNQNSFALVDIDDSPVSEDTFVGATGDIRLHAITLLRDSEILVGFELAFLDGATTPQVKSRIQFLYSGSGIDLSDMNNRNLFYGTSNTNLPIVDSAVVFIQGITQTIQMRSVNNLSLWGHYFGDSEDDFRVIDQLPVVILDALTMGDSIFLDEIASGRAEVPRGTTKFYATLDPVYTGRATALDNDIGRFEIEADGSWTYTITSLNELEAAARAVDLGHTLDLGETLTRTFYLHAIDETLSGANRLATLELDVQINGMSIIAAPEGQTTNRLRPDPDNPDTTLFIGADGVDMIRTAESGFDDDRKIVFGGPGDDIIGTGNEGAISIYHSFSSGDGSSWENTDGADVIRRFTRNRDKFILVDESDNPVSEADFINPLIADGRVILQAFSVIATGRLVRFELAFLDSRPDSRIVFEYVPGSEYAAGGILITPDNEALFFGENRNGVGSGSNIGNGIQRVTVTDRNLWGNYFGDGDGDDSFQVIDELPAVIADAVARKNIFLDQTAFGSAEPPPPSNTLTTYEVSLLEAGSGSVRQIDGGFGEFKIDPDTGIWTYALTSYNSLNNFFSNITGVRGSTLDTGDTLTRTFYIHTVQEGSRIATQEVNVTLHGLNIVSVNQHSNVIATGPGNNVYIGDAMDNTVFIAPGRHVVFGGLGEDTIRDNDNPGEVKIYHRFSSTGNAQWENTDGEDVINDFVRNEDTFTLVDIDTTPTDEAALFGSNVRLRAITDSGGMLESFDLIFRILPNTQNDSSIRFNYETPIDVSGTNGDPFFGEGRSGISSSVTTSTETRSFIHTSLWGNYFGDDEDNFQVIDALPAVIDDLI